jgi:hypothetical protein
MPTDVSEAAFSYNYFNSPSANEENVSLLRNAEVYRYTRKSKPLAIIRSYKKAVLYDPKIHFLSDPL